MKQHISKEQVLSLTDKQYVGLINALYETSHKVKDLSRGSAGCDFGNEEPYFTSAMETRTNIGKMIEILSNVKQIEITQGSKWWVMFMDKSLKVSEYELYDALWLAIKEIL